MGGTIIPGAEDVAPDDIETDAPYQAYRRDGEAHRVDCDFIAGCDGVHGVGRTVVPADVRRTFETIHPFGWLGVPSHTPPATQEVACNRHECGFAPCGMRSESLSRYCIQCRLDAGGCNVLD